MNKKSLGYICGQIASAVVVGCIMAALVALTVRFIGWIF